MRDPTVMLVDNGSTRPAATLSLRTIAAGLSRVCARPVFPVSLQHADRVDAADLGGELANVLPAFLRARLALGERSFIALPLFFGPSRALTSYLPQQLALLRAEFGDLSVRQADVLAPAPTGEPRLARILAEHIEPCRAVLGGPPSHVLVVDHGSPLPAVTAVRHAAAEGLRAGLAAEIRLGEAVMERRPGAQYDFNGPLLATALDRCAAERAAARVALAMMFLSPGRHAGPGGDIAALCAAAEARNPGLRTAISPLVGEHPLLLEILRDRLAAVG